MKSFFPNGHQFFSLKRLLYSCLHLWYSLGFLSEILILSPLAKPWHSFTLFWGINSHGNCQWALCPVSGVTGANEKEHFSFIPFQWFSDHLPWKADYFDRTRLGSGCMCSQTSRSERTGNYWVCEGLFVLIQISHTSLTMTLSSATLLICSLSNLEIWSQDNLWYQFFFQKRRPNKYSVYGPYDFWMMNMKFWLL